MELLPCPFCGGTDLYWPHGTDPAIIECGGKNGCGARSGVPDDQTQADAIAAWNRRAPQPQRRMMMSDMTLQEAIAEMKDTSGLVPWDIACDAAVVILNAVASGDLIPKADAEQAMALVALLRKQIADMQGGGDAA